MGSNPINLGVRFLLELVAWGSAGYLGWAYFSGPLQIVSAVALPIMSAAIWGIFAVPGDPSRSGKAPVPVPGVVRLLIEFATFSLPAVGLYLVAANYFAVVFSIVVLIHYLLSYDRISWLLKQ